MASRARRATPFIQRIAHGYIFSGHRGIGKTTIARILAMALNCRKADRPTPDPGACDLQRDRRSMDVMNDATPPRITRSASCTTPSATARRDRHKVTS
jgi:DNA polymerase III delta prime subunit